MLNVLVRCVDPGQREGRRLQAGAPPSGAQPHDCGREPEPGAKGEPNVLLPIPHHREGME